MRTLLLIAALLAGASVPARAGDLGTLEAKWPAQDIEELRVHFPVGELIFEAGETPEVRAELSVRCRHGGNSCVERSKRLRLVTHVAGKTRYLDLEGMPKFGSHGLEATLHILVPKTLAVDAEMGVGDLRVEGITGDLRLELGVGEVTVLAKQAGVKSVNLTVGIGDATLSHGGSSQAVSGLLGRKVRWSDGAGAARVSVELGVGDIAVRLD
jgi:hypothetical protein